MSSYSVRLLFVPFLFVCITSLLGQVEEYEWPEDIKPTEGIDLFKGDHDAAILYEHHIMDFTNFARGITGYQVNKRIKIFTEVGLNQYSYIYIPIRVNQQIEMIDAVTIKKDGRIINLDAGDIYSIDQYIEEEEEEVSEDMLISYSKFAIPGVEVGDEIEIVYRMSLYDYTGGDVLPNAEVFSFNTTYNFLLPSNVDFACQLNNGFPNPGIYYWSGNGHRAEFLITNTPSIADESFAIPQLTLPWFSFKVTPFQSVYQTDHTNDWVMMYQTLIGMLQNPSKNNKKQLLHYQQVVRSETEGEESKYNKFLRLYHYLSDSLEYREFIDDKEMEKSNEFFLYNGYINNTIRYRLALQFLDELALDHYVCFARNRYRGPIKITDPRIEEVDEVLLLIRDERNEPHYLFLNHPISYYEIDEIPSHLSGSKVAFINPSKGFQLDSLVLPEWETYASCGQETLDIDFDPEHTDTSRMDVHATYTGHMATLNRGISYLMLNDTLFRSAFNEFRKYERPDVIIDTGHMEKANHLFPFEVGYTSQVRIAGAFEIINDTLMSIPLDFYINHPMLETKTKSRLLDCYPQYRYTDTIQARFHFPEYMQIDVLNRDALDLETTNNAGSFSLHLEQGTNSIRLISNYTVSASRIPVEDVGDIDRLNETCQRGKQSALLVSFKPAGSRSSIR